MIGRDGDIAGTNPTIRFQQLKFDAALTIDLRHHCGDRGADTYFALSFLVFQQVHSRSTRKVPIFIDGSKTLTMTKDEDWLLTFADWLKWGMSTPRPDIAAEAHIKILVDSFYSKVNADALLSPIFNDVAQVDWQTHMPLLYQFWSTLLFRTNSYEGRPWPKHARLPVDAEHFERWVSLFKQTVDEHFSGLKADEAKNFAASIAHTFQNRLALMKSQGL
jgi:hemoglobin